MKRFQLIVLLGSICLSLAALAGQAQEKREYVIVVHGGAGAMSGLEQNAELSAPL